MPYDHCVTSRFRLHRATLAPLMIAVLLAATTGLAHSAGEKAEAPQLRIGDRWKYEQKDRRTGLKESASTRTVSTISTSLIEGAENDGTFKMTPELNPIESTTLVVTGEPRFLTFPLEVGKKWDLKYNFANKTNESKGRVKQDVEVMAYEKVTVTAGSFDAFRIESKGFWNNDTTRASGRSKSVYWYAPAARTVVRTEYEDGYNYWVRDLVELQLQP